MKDSIISAKAKKRELTIFIIIFIASFILNIISIIAYNTDWIEVLSALHYVLIFAVVIYVLQGVVRLIIWGITRLVSSKKSEA
jgi:heme/copper-type cytochrome/quinol oxidase subunit 4